MSASRLEPPAPRSGQRADESSFVDTGGARDRDPELSLLSAVNVMLRRRALVLGVALSMVATVLAVRLLLPRSYTSTASFVPQTNRNTPGSGGGLAAQLGLSMMLTTDPTQSPAFYVDLLTSHGVLDSTVATRFRITRDGRAADSALTDLLHAKGETPAQRRDDATKRLRRLVRAESAPKTGVVTLSVRAKDPILARDVANRFLELVSDFNLRHRKTQASEERRFAEQRLIEVGQELRVAEDRLQMFLQRNRVYENAPELRFAFDRLSREVTMRQQVYTSVAQAEEQARMDEVRDTPVLTIIEQPNVPARPDSRGLVKWSAVGLILGLGLGTALAFLREMMSRAETEPGDEIQQFNALWRETMRDFARPWRPVARAFRPARAAR
jgi:uncharacterized protein involved in exopolysaccharide biosynthesis